MATADAGEGIPSAEADDVVPDSVDFKGHPSVRSKSGCWKSAFFIAGSFKMRISQFSLFFWMMELFSNLSLLKLGGLILIFCSRVWNGGEVLLLRNWVESGELFNRWVRAIHGRRRRELERMVRHGGAHAGSRRSPRRLGFGPVQNDCSFISALYTGQSTTLISFFQLKRFSLLNMNRAWNFPNRDSDCWLYHLHSIHWAPPPAKMVKTAHFVTHLSFRIYSSSFHCI